MNYRKYLSLFTLAILFLQYTTAQVGIGNINPRPGAILDVEDSKGYRGILIPRVDIEDLNTLAPITTTNATESLLVYNTNTSTGKGFYYWNGTNSWIPVGKETSTSGLQFYSYDYGAEGSSENPPALPNRFNPKTEDKAGHYIGSLNVSSSNFLGTGLMPNSNDTFIIKLTGYYNAQNTGYFTISSLSDDGVRLYIDDVLIIDVWHDGGNVSGSGTINLAKGKHKFEFWYYENTGGEKFNFTWGSNPDGNSGSLHANDFTVD